MKADHAIILAAGKSLQLDGKNKVLIRHPQSQKTILDRAIEAFAGKHITVVVGFGALQIMERYPQLHYVINENWANTNNAMSLGLALSQVGEPTYVVSGDIFFSGALIAEMDNRSGNLILTEERENRMLTSLHCELDAQGKISNIYGGPIRASQHPEAIGLFKISDRELLKSWHKQCLRFGNLFAGQTLPCQEDSPLYAHDLGTHPFCEINSIADYWRLVQTEYQP